KLSFTKKRCKLNIISLKFIITIKSTLIKKRMYMKRYFQFDELGTNYRREALGGITTFLSMRYVLAVNPTMLRLAVVYWIPDDMRMDINAVFVATCLAAFVGTFSMGVGARYPVALAAGMGLDAFFAFSVVVGMGVPWQTALS